MHRPRYALVYNNIIEDSFVDSHYHKVLNTICLKDSEGKWKTITYQNDEYKKLQEIKIYTYILRLGYHLVIWMNLKMMKTM